MRTPTLRFGFAVLAASVALAACKDSPLQPRTPDTTIRAMPIDELAPIDEGGGDTGGGDTGGGETGGGTGGGGSPAPPPPFNPPPAPFFIAPGPALPVGSFSNTFQHCNQLGHVGIAFSNDVTQGTVLYAWGVVVPHSRANFAIYNQFGQLIKTHLTDEAHDNCVIHHEPETISTWDMAPGYYYVYASYWTLTNDGFFELFDGWPTGHGGKFVTALRIR